MQICLNCEAKFDKPEYQYCSGWCQRRHQKQQAKDALYEAIFKLPTRQSILVMSDLLLKGKL